MRQTKMSKLKEDLQASVDKARTAVDIFERIHSKSRGQRNTEALIQASRHKAAIIVTQNADVAEALNTLQGVSALAYTNPLVIQTSSPIVIDLPTIYELTKTCAALEKHATTLLAFLNLKNID